MPIADKVAYADNVIDNSGTKHELETQIDNLVQRLDAEAGWFWRVSWLLPPVGLVSAGLVLLWRALRQRKRTRRGARKHS